MTSTQPPTVSAVQSQLHRASVPTKVRQLVVHSVSGLYITPALRLDSDVEVRLWRQGATSTDSSAMWEFHPAGQDGLYRIKNAKYNRCLTLRESQANTVVYQTPWSEGHRGQLWYLDHADPAQGDVVIASALDRDLVICPKESYHSPEVPLEVDERGPFTDQFWRWRTPRE